VMTSDGCERYEHGILHDVDREPPLFALLVTSEPAKSRSVGDRRYQRLGACFRDRILKA
jgi:hypothetical protein